VILAASSIAALCVAYIAYRLLFYDRSDFWDGLLFITRTFHRRHLKPWPKGGASPAPEDLEDDSWYSALRFVAFIAVSIGTGYYVYGELQKYFG
jgi:hypothetical protein